MSPEVDRLAQLEAMIREQGRAQASLIDTVDKLLPILARSPSHASTSNAARATVTQNDRTPMWVCVVAVAVFATALLAQAGQKNLQAVAMQADMTRLQGQLSDVRADLKELRAVDQELRSTDNAVRAYINTGILKPKAEVGKK